MNTLLKILGTTLIGLLAIVVLLVIVVGFITLCTKFGLQWVLFGLLIFLVAWRTGQVILEE